MTYIEVKTINGRQYKYVRRSIREGKSVRHLNLKYLGPVEPIYNIGKNRKTNASIYVRKLTQKEVKVLRRASHSQNSFTRDRAKILLLSSQRNFPRKISEKIGCEVRKVRKAIKAFNERGLKAIERGKAKGAKPKFSKEQRAKILMIANTEPSKLGMHFTTWSLPKLKQYFVENKVVDDISVESVRGLLKSERMKIRKSKRFQYSNDPEFDKKNFR